MPTVSAKASAVRKKAPWTTPKSRKECGLSLLIARAAMPKTTAYSQLRSPAATKGSMTIATPRLWKDGKLESGNNTWSLAEGSGKFKGVKGQGGCKGKGKSGRL